jgi:hypothetical protein
LKVHKHTALCSRPLILILWQCPAWAERSALP